MPTFAKDEGPWLSADNVQTGDVITFIDEGVEVPKEFKGKTTLKIEIGIKLPNGEEKVATLNPTSRNLLVDFYGMEPLKGKDGRIDIERKKIDGVLKSIVYVCPPNMDRNGEIVQKN